MPGADSRQRRTAANSVASDSALVSLPRTRAMTPPSANANTRHRSDCSALAQATYRECGRDSTGTHQPKSSAITSPATKPAARNSSASHSASAFP